MSQKILVFAGRKQSGKSTGAKYITGLKMRDMGIINDFKITEQGELLVPTTVNGKEVFAELDIYRKDFEFARWASQKIWPLAKVYSFAEELKASIVNIFGLNPQNIYGSDEDKNKPTHITWKNIEKFIDTSNTYARTGDYVTHRQLMQIWGSDVNRAIDPDCWIRSCFDKIALEKYPYAIIDDCRFDNEALYCNKLKKQGYDVFIVRLSKCLEQDSHSSEKIMEMPSKYVDMDIDNQNMTLKEKHEMIDEALMQSGWYSATLES